MWFCFSFQFFFHVSHHFASNVKWCDDKRFRLDPPNLFIQNLVWNAQTYKTSWIMKFGENNFFNTPWWRWWNSIPPIVVSLWWTPPLLLLLLLLLFYCWACWVGFNKESEQQHERINKEKKRNIERKKEGGLCDRSKGLFFGDVFFPFLILHTTNSKVLFLDGILFVLFLFFTKLILRSRPSLKFNSSWSFKPKTNKNSQNCLCGFFSSRNKPRGTP